MRRATSPTWWRTRRRSANSAHAIWCAAASRKRQKANRAAAPWCWNSQATTPRSPAIARPAIRPQKSYATARPNSTWSSSKATAARNFEGRSGIRLRRSFLRQLDLADRGDAFGPLALDLLLLGAVERLLQLIQHRLGRMPGDRGLDRFDAGEARGFVVGQGGAPRQYQDSDGGKPSSVAHRVHSCRG